MQRIHRIVSIGLLALIASTLAIQVAVATTTTTSATISQSFGEVESLSGVNSNLLQQAYNTSYVYASGTGTDNFDLPLYVDNNASLASSASVTRDLTSFTAQDGSTVTTAGKLKALVIKNTSSNAGTTITVGNATSNGLQGAGFLDGATSIVTLNKGQMIMWVIETGLTIDATHKNVKILNNDGANAASYVMMAIVSSS